MKKKIKDTKLGKFLANSGSKIVEIAGDAFPPIEVISNLIAGDPELTAEQKQQAQQLALEAYRLEIEDRKSARSREVELAKTGRSDWMMYLSGCTAMGVFVLMVIAVIWQFPGVNSTLFHQLMGIIEGVSLTVFAYYFGTSKSSNEKTKLLSNLK